MSTKLSTSPRPGRKILPHFTLLWLDVFCLLAWAVLLLQYWYTGRITLLLHPNYAGLTACTGVALLVMGGWKGWLLRKKKLLLTPQHKTLFPPGFGSGLLLVVALIGLAIAPKAFASSVALQRGVTDSTFLLRGVSINEKLQPQAFAVATAPESRSLIDWIRTLTVYPEPDAYAGQKASVQGFVTYDPSFPDDYILITRFVITCCAADAYPVGLPVKLTQQNRADYPPDQWLEIKGVMMTETLANQRRLVIAADQIQAINEPTNPYDY
jgi:uncharacterized repeat protein (TIGR03943 family)